ncbi:hypothetical protein [Catelliglobosispora koreensis]|uniref:hypothetical protein n=1 Tax=Catelliglobosispora koreensis TaxID=129052 RepID=UPI00037229BA|nr:hypothetical protein [Catelliglobosispora koreensis]
MNECDLLENPTGCLGDVAGGIVSGAASNAWESVCKSFADGAVALLGEFANLFVNFPNADLTAVAQPNGPYAISMWIASGIAVLLLLGQVIRTAVTNDGSAIAQGLVGAGKLLLAIIATLTIATAAMAASDEISKGIVDRSLGGSDGLKKSLTGLFAFSQAGAAPGQAKLVAPASLVLILALVGAVLTLILWFEMLLRNAAILILVATAPIAAAGQLAESTRSWWTKLCSATIQLIILKPIITLIFAIGFGIASKPGDVTDKNDVARILSGMLILLLAVVAWPVIARFFTFAQVSFAGGGMAGMLGFAAGRANAGSGGPVGVNPSEFSQMTEARTMASAGAAESSSVMGAGSATGALSATGGGAAASGGAASGGAMAGAGALGAVAAPLAVAAAGIDIAQRGVNALAGRMEQMAGHAGIHGAHPHARPAGHAQFGGSWSSPGGGQAAPQAELDRSGQVATMPVSAGGMPETRAADHTVAVDPPPPVSPVIPVQAQPHSVIEEVGR